MTVEDNPIAVGVGVGAWGGATIAFVNEPGENQDGCREPRSTWRTSPADPFSRAVRAMSPSPSTHATGDHMSSNDRKQLTPWLLVALLAVALVASLLWILWHDCEDVSDVDGAATPSAIVARDFTIVGT